MAPLVKIYPRLFPWNSGPLRTPGPGTLGQKRRRSVDRRASERASKRASDRLVGQVRGGKGRTLSQKDAKQRASERASVCQPWPWQVVARRKASAVQRPTRSHFWSTILSLLPAETPNYNVCSPCALHRGWTTSALREFFFNRLPSLDEWSLSTAGQPERQPSNGWMDRGREWRRGGREDCCQPANEKRLRSCAACT